MLGTGLEPTQEDLDMVNVAIKLSSGPLLPPGTELRTEGGEVLRVLYHGQGGRFTIVQPVVRGGGCEVTGLSKRESRLTARLYSYVEVVSIPRSAPPFHSWKRRRHVPDAKGEALERQVLMEEEV
jgi:hypothetical protein